MLNLFAEKCVSYSLDSTSLQLHGVEIPESATSLILLRRAVSVIILFWFSLFICLKTLFATTLILFRKLSQVFGGLVTSRKCVFSGVRCQECRGTLWTGLAAVQPHSAHVLFLFPGRTFLSNKNKWKMQKNPSKERNVQVGQKIASFISFAVIIVSPFVQFMLTRSRT